MFQIRLHGRGGQGVVTAAELLSVAAFHEGRFAQAFPSFGSERMGAPVVAFCRIDDSQIRLREPITDPDAVVIQDATLLHQIDVFAGLDAGDFLLLNSHHSIDELGIAELADRIGRDHICTLPATDIARECVGRPLPNAAMLGGLAAMTGIVSLQSVQRAIRERFPAGVGEKNAAAAARAAELVTSQIERMADAHAKTN